MSRPQESSEGDRPIERGQLASFFQNAEKPDPSTHVVGTELEKFGVVVGSRDEPVDVPYPVRFDAHVVPVLQGLVDRFGWRPGTTRGDKGQLVELVRDGASITLEPGGQLELSGAPLQTIHQTCAEFTQHYEELHAVSEPLGIGWMTVGFHPWATREEIDLVPKGRYRVMREYLPTRGGHALDMMLRTCTVQANFDYSSEADCGERFRLALAVGPLITAAFANSPYREGEVSGYCSLRSEVWFDVDPDRCGIPRFMFDQQPFSYERYVDWALDIPMFFVERDGVFHRHHVPFRQFLRDGWRDPSGRLWAATYRDWALHLSTVFPEVRLKPFVEVRTADAVTSAYVCALPALWKGLLYDADARELACSLVSECDYDTLKEMWSDARRVGLRSPRVLQLCQRLVEAARESLDRFDVRDGKNRTEARFLDPLQELLASGRCPGDLVAQRLGPSPGRDAKARREFVRSFYFAGAEPPPLEG